MGRIGKPQGIKGEVTVQVRTDDPAARFADGAVLLTDPPERGPLTVAAARDQNGRLVVAFAGVVDRNAAEALRGTVLQVDARTLPPPEDEDEFHDHVLRGLRAELPDGAVLGEVADVLHLPHGDVLVIARADTGAEVLVPFVKAMVPVVDVAGRRVQVDPPEGLLDLGEPRRGARSVVIVDVVTIFPDYLAPLGVSLLGKAQERGLLTVRVHDLRTWTSDVHRTVDDSPYGGGPGMVMRPEPWGAALDAVRALGGTDTGTEAVPVLLVPTPSGRPFTQALAQELSDEPWLVFACGRYEGIDARVLEDAAERFRVVEVSLGDYVLAGGEVAVLVVVEAVARLLPGVLGNAASHQDDSFAAGGMEALLEGPVYTRPPVWRGREVPAVLQSGDHARIARWRREQALQRTAERRPDLLASAESPSADDRAAPPQPAPQADPGRPRPVAQ